MSNQSKAGIFGSSSTHKIKNATHSDRQVLTPENFLGLDEIKAWVDSHPGSVTVVDGEYFLSRELSLRYLHLCGKKRLKKILSRSKRISE